MARTGRAEAATVDSARLTGSGTGDVQLRGVRAATVPVRADHQSKRTLVLGVAGGRRNAAVAAVLDGRLDGFCEQERVSRIRAVALQPGRIPLEAVEAALRNVERVIPEEVLFATAEPDVCLASAARHESVGHHRAHAATAVLTSPHQAA